MVYCLRPQHRNRTSYIMKKTLFTLLCCLIFGSLNAEDRTYDVEIIIFENSRGPISNTNYWKPEILVPNLSNTLAFPEDEAAEGHPSAPSSASEQQFLKLQSDTYFLNAQKEALSRSSRYNVLTHLRWRQPGLAKANALPLRIKTGTPFPLYLLSQPDHSLSTTTKHGESFFFARDRQPELPDLLSPVRGYPLDGSVTIYLGRYLHIVTDLILTLPAPDNLPVSIETNQEPGARLGKQSYRLNIHRRMRSKEIHYLDHPKFGLIVYIEEFKRNQDSSN